MAAATENTIMLGRAAHEPEAIGEGISREIIEVIKHRKDTSGLDEAEAIVIDLGREIFGARKVASATLVEAKPCSGFGKLVSAPTIWHSVSPQISRVSPRLSRAVMIWSDSFIVLG